MVNVKRGLALLPIIVGVLGTVPAHAASSATIAATPAHGTDSTQFNVVYTPADSCAPNSPPLELQLFWDGARVAHVPAAPCPGTSTIKNVTPPPGPPQAPTNAPGWHTLTAHLAMPDDQEPRSGFASSRYFVDPAGDAHLAFSPTHARWFDNFRMTYTVPSGFACTQQYVEFSLDAVPPPPSPGYRPWARAQLACPTADRTMSFNGQRAPGTHTIWAYVVDAGWQRVKGTEAYAEFTVDPGDPPVATPAPPLGSTGGGPPPQQSIPATGGGSTQATTGAQAPPPGPTTPGGGGVAAQAAVPAAGTPQAGPRVLVASPSPRTDTTTSPALAAALGRVIAGLGSRAAAGPTGAAVLLAVLAAWIIATVLHLIPSPPRLLRSVATRIRGTRG